MALQKTGYRKVRSGLTISRRDSDYMTATYSGIDPELRRLSRAGAFGVDGHVGNMSLIRLWHLSAMVTTNGIHIAHAEPDRVERGKEGKRQHRANGSASDQHVGHGSPEHGMRERN